MFLKRNLLFIRKLSLTLWKDLIKESHQTYCPLSKHECNNHKTFARTDGSGDQDSALRLLCNGFKLCFTLKKLAQGIIHS